MNNVYVYIAAMALVTYLIRMVPLTLIRREIKNRFVKSFLFYVPYATLAAMTFPAILTSTSSVISAAAGLFVALVLSYKDLSMPLVAALSCAAVFVVEFVC